MVRKFVFVPGAEPRVSSRGTERAANLGRVSVVGVRHEPPVRVMQWLLVGLALAASAMAFSAAKTVFERQSGPAVTADR